MPRNNDKVPIRYIESIKPDGTKTIKPKTCIEQFQQYTDGVYEKDMKPTGKQLTESNSKTMKSKSKKISYGRLDLEHSTKWQWQNLRRKERIIKFHYGIAEVFYAGRKHLSQP